jgi:hypothetical protein
VRRGVFANRDVIELIGFSGRGDFKGKDSMVLLLHRVVPWG